jgi:hypothetical protein
VAAHRLASESVSPASRRVTPPSTVCTPLPSQSAAAVRHLPWTSNSLQHIQPHRSTEHGHCRVHFGPSAGFDYPLDGLRPVRPRRPCFMPAALMGFALRSVPLSPGRRGVSAEAAPTYRFSRACSTHARRHATAGHTGRGFWALRARVPGVARGFRAGRRWLLPWALHLPGYLYGRLCRDFARHPLTCFTTHRPKPAGGGTPGCRSATASSDILKALRATPPEAEQPS